MSYANLYRPDQLFLPHQKLAEFAKTVPTPFYLYHEEGIRKAAQLIRGSFCWAPVHQSWFPLSVNACPQILNLFREAGFGALTGSIPELELAKMLGFTKIAFHTPAMTDAAVQAAKSAAAVIFDAPGQIEAFAGALPERCMLRYFPETLPGGVRAAAVRRQTSGMDRAELFKSVRRLRALGAKQIGLYCCLPSHDGGESVYPAAASMLFRLAGEILTQTGVRISCIHLGGLGFIGDASRGTLQLSRVGALIRDAFRNDLPDGHAPELHTEFGRYAVARHGLIVCRVAEVREQTRRCAIVDASTAQVPDLLLGGVRHPISVVGNCGKSGRSVYSVHGCTPDVRERFCDRAILPTLKPGSLLVIRFAGACCESMQFSRAMLPRPGSWLYTCDGRFVPTA